MGDGRRTLYIELTEHKIAVEWHKLIEELQTALTMAHQALKQVREEIYISQFDRLSKEHEAERLIRRISDDLIALGTVQTRAEAARLVTTG